MATMQLTPDWSEFFTLLNANGVEYLVVGGHAVTFHGAPRATNDLDIWVASTPENAARVMPVLAEFGFQTEPHHQELLQRPDQIFRMGAQPHVIEILTSIDGVDFDECYPNRVVHLAEGIPINFISMEDLKKNKNASGRLRDLADVEALEGRI